MTTYGEQMMLKLFVDNLVTGLTVSAFNSARSLSLVIMQVHKLKLEHTLDEDDLVNQFHWIT